MTRERRALLGAVVAHLTPAPSARRPLSAAQSPGGAAGRGRSNLVYLVVIAATAAWITLVAQGLLGK